MIELPNLVLPEFQICGSRRPSPTNSNDQTLKRGHVDVAEQEHSILVLLKLIDHR